MKLSAIAFTEQGQSWSAVLGVPVDRGIPVMRWAREHFDASDALLFIGACGIAVRAIAPLVKDKTTDPAVVVMDEAGRHVIPLLSGHIGGANALAIQIAEKTGAIPVVTTATDLRGIPAIDTWAVENDCAIENPAVIKAMSAAALAGRKVWLVTTEATVASAAAGDAGSATLTLSAAITTLAANTVISPQGAGAAGVDVYSTLIIADNAYGVTKLANGGLEHIVKQRGSAGTADPLNQRGTVGWKATKTAEILVQQYMVRIESTATP